MCLHFTSQRRRRDWGHFDHERAFLACIHDPLPLLQLSTCRSPLIATVPLHFPWCMDGSLFVIGRSNTPTILQRSLTLLALLNVVNIDTWHTRKFSYFSCCNRLFLSNFGNRRLASFWAQRQVVNVRMSFRSITLSFFSFKICWHLLESLFFPSTPFALQPGCNITPLSWLSPVGSLCCRTVMQPQWPLFRTTSLLLRPGWSIPLSHSVVWWLTVLFGGQQRFELIWLSRVEVVGICLQRWHLLRLVDKIPHWRYALFNILCAACYVFIKVLFHLIVVVG